MVGGDPNCIPAAEDSVCFELPHRHHAALPKLKEQQQYGNFPFYHPVGPIISFMTSPHPAMNKRKGVKPNQPFVHHHPFLVDRVFVELFDGDLRAHARSPSYQKHLPVVKRVVVERFDGGDARADRHPATHIHHALGSPRVVVEQHEYGVRARKCPPTHLPTYPFTANNIALCAQLKSDAITTAYFRAITHQLHPQQHSRIPECVVANQCENYY